MSLLFRRIQEAVTYGIAIAAGLRVSSSKIRN